MDAVTIVAVCGVALAVGAYLAGRARRPGGAAETRVYGTIESMRRLGELSVFKVLTKEIVATDQHCFGEVGKRYFEWMVSSKKMVMILSFDIDFRYDLRSGEFTIAALGADAYRLSLPPCFYEVHIRDISIYDEQNSKLLPWLLPELVTRVFGGVFSAADKNRLIEEAKRQAAQQAETLVGRMRGEVQQSARQTLEILARGFGAAAVEVAFADQAPVQSRIRYDAPGEAA